MLKDKPIATEIKTMLIFSLILHVGIVLALVYYSDLVSRKRIKQDERMSFIWAAPVKKTSLKSDKNKLPPPIIVPVMQPPKSKEKAKIVIKEDKKKPARIEKQRETKSDTKKEEIAKALSDIYSDLEKRKMPKADNYSLEDIASMGAGGSEKGMMDPERLSYIVNVKSLIVNNWHVINKAILHQLRDPKVLLTIKINNDGYIVSKKLEKSSGNSSYDQSVLRAVDKSDPLPPPPANIAKEALTEGITLDFDPPME